MSHAVRSPVRIRRSLGSLFLLMGAALCTHAQTPPTQPASPQAAEERAPSHRNTDTLRRDEDRSCESLSAPERTECERRDVMQEKERAASEAAPTASEAESDADVAGEQPSRSTTRIRQATREPTTRDDAPEDDAASTDAQSEDAHDQEQHQESNSEADTLGPPGS
jgi:hypothetical protein